MLDNDPEMQQAIEEKPLGDAAEAAPEKPAEEAKPQEAPPAGESDSSTSSAAEPAREAEQKPAAEAEPEAEKAAAPEAEQKPDAEAKAKPEVEAKTESPARRPSGGADDNVVFIGKKDVMSYVLAVMTQFNNEQNEVIIKARGRTISRAVDVAEISRQKISGISPAKIEISTEEIQGDEGTVKVSAIEITLSKK